MEAKPNQPEDDTPEGRPPVKDPEVCACGDPECYGSVRYPHPFRIGATYDEDAGGTLTGYYSIRTSSWEWGGERTDLHDMFGLLLGMSLRVREAASARLLAELNPAIDIDSEIYARILVLGQQGSLARLRERAYIMALSDEAFAAEDLTLAMFDHSAAGAQDPLLAGATYDDPPAWVEAVRHRLRLSTISDWEFRDREAFGWRVFTSLKRQVTVADLGSAPVSRLRDAFAGFRPTVADVGDALAFRSDQMINAVSNKALTKGKSLLRLVEQESDDPLMIPMDSHVVMVGRRAIVAIAAECGADAFEGARVGATARREREAEVFMSDARIVWNERPDPMRFEDLIGELLKREAGMHWVRQVGATREPDDGRDFIVDWSAAAVGLKVEGVADGLRPPNGRRRIIVQVKVRSRGVNRSDLPGLRDTMEHHDAAGMLVVAYPRVTVQLMDHLDRLRRDGTYWIDWWGTPEIDRRLRMNLDIAGRYRDLVSIIPAR